MTLTEKAAYIKGMMEGMNFEPTTNEGKILAKVVELLDEIALTVEDLENQVDAIDDFTDELAEYAEQIDDDLTDLEDIVMDEDEDEEEDGEDDEEDWDDEEDDEDDEDYDGYEVECPVCGKTVFFTDEDDPEDVVCPACGEHFSCVCDGNCDDCGDPCPAKDEK